MGVIETCHRLVVQAGVALRAVPRVITIFCGVPDATTPLPAATSVRWWLQRLGLFALREELEVAEDWVYLIDHSVQIGTVKVCVILGLRLCDVPFPARALRHDDVRVLAVIPIEKSTGEVVESQLEQAAGRTGIPRQIVSDHGRKAARCSPGATPKRSSLTTRLITARSSFSDASKPTHAGPSSSLGWVKSRPASSKRATRFYWLPVFVRRHAT